MEEFLAYWIEHFIVAVPLLLISRELIAIARRGGTTAALDDLQKYIGINQMPMVTSTYWNLGHGGAPGEVEQDGEGMQTFRNIGRNMAWLLKCIEAGKQAGYPHLLLKGELVPIL